MDNTNGLVAGDALGQNIIGTNMEKPILTHLEKKLETIQFDSFSNQADLLLNLNIGVDCTEKGSQKNILLSIN